MSATFSETDQPVRWESDLLRALYELVFSAPDREVAGMLVGIPGTGNRFPMVRAAIPATEGYAPGQASVFAHQTLAQVHATMARHYQQLEVVGWYVSRPGAGVGLTEADTINHARWFARPDQILLVVDSQSHQVAIYVWRDQQLIQLTSGVIARRRDRPAPARFPAAALTLLIIIGIALGAIAFVIAQAFGG
jgi:hypothetical protein